MCPTYYRNDFVDEEIFHKSYLEEMEKYKKQEHIDELLLPYKEKNITNLKEILEIELKNDVVNYEIIDYILRNINTNEIISIFPDILNVISKGGSEYFINYYYFYNYYNRNNSNFRVPLEMVIDTIILNKDSKVAANFLINDQEKTSLYFDEIKGNEFILLKRKLIDFIIQSRNGEAIYLILLYVKNISFDQIELLLDSLLCNDNYVYIKQFLKYAPSEFLTDEFVSRAKEIVPDRADYRIRKRFKPYCPPSNLKLDKSVIRKNIFQK